MTVAKDPRYARYLKMIQVVSHQKHLLLIYRDCKNIYVLSCILIQVILSQGVPVMAIRNKMMMEGLDPNLLEWVFYTTTCDHLLIFSCLNFVQQGFITLTNNNSLTAYDSSPDAPVPDGGTKSAEGQDVAATSSDSESSFSDWCLFSTLITAELHVKAVLRHLTFSRSVHWTRESRLQWRSDEQVLM